jgi:hypothetical protein
MMVHLLTEEQKQLLENIKYAENSYFNPVKNSDDNWVISDLEVNDCNNNDLEWIKYLPKIEFKESKSNEEFREKYINKITCNG